MPTPFPVLTPPATPTPFAPPTMDPPVTPAGPPTPLNSAEELIHEAAGHALKMNMEDVDNPLSSPRSCRR